MAKFKFTLGIGLAGCRQEEEYEISDEELEGLDSDERNKSIEEYWQEWVNGLVDGGWDEIE